MQFTNEKGEKFETIEPPEEFFENEFQLTGDNTPLYELEKIEFLKDIGTISHYKGIPYKRKGFVHPQSLYPINIIKRMIKESLKYPFLFLFYKKEKLLESFNEIFNKAYHAYKIKPEYLCVPAYSFGEFLYKTFKLIKIKDSIAYETAFNLAQILETDDVYRYRMQDLVDVMDLKGNPRKEIKKALKELKKREIDGAIYKKIKKIIPFLFLLPKKLPIYLLENCKTDEDDWYWTYFNSHAYKYGGMSKDMRKIEKYPEIITMVKT